MIKAEIRFKNATLMNALENSKYNSIAELSRVSEIPTGTLYQIASLNHTKISTENQVKLAEMLNCSVYDLFEQYAEVVKKSKNYPNKISKDIPIDSMLSLSSKEVMQLELGSNIDDEVIHEQSLKIEINDILNTLKDREKEVLNHHFGLNGYEQLNLDEIGRMFSISRERVRQVKEKALRRLRHRSRSEEIANGYYSRFRKLNPTKRDKEMELWKSENKWFNKCACGRKHKDGGDC